MNFDIRSIFHSFIPLVVLTALFMIESWVFAAHGATTPDGTGLLWEFVFALAITSWTHEDRRIRELRVPFEFDVFVFFAWPVAVPYYLYRSRGGRGLLLGAAIWGLFIAPYLVAAIVQVAKGK